MTAIRAVVFDLGGVLIDWDPRHLYRKLFDGDDEAMEEFLATVCTMEWNAGLDAGRPFAEGVTELVRSHPEQAELIEAFHRRWPETCAGPIEDTVALLDELRVAGVPTYALSNWSAETYPLARPRFPFLEWFAGVLISGEIGLTKPDPRIYLALCDRFALSPASSIFVDDSPPNVEVAAELGFEAVLFRTAGELRTVLVRHRLLG